MKNCEHCGNSYDRCFDITTQDGTFTFDSFECAIQKLAPVCPTCGCRVIGHGVEAEGEIFCCGHCSREAGAGGIVDNADKDGEP